MKKGSPVLMVRGPFAGHVGYYDCAIRDGVHIRVDIADKTVRKLVAALVEYKNVLELSALVTPDDPHC